MNLSKYSNHYHNLILGDLNGRIILFISNFFFMISSVSAILDSIFPSVSLTEPLLMSFDNRVHTLTN